jgi:hypothetical protein
MSLRSIKKRADSLQSARLDEKVMSDFHHTTALPL